MGAPEGVENGKTNSNVNSSDVFNPDVIYSHLGKIGKFQIRFWICMSFTLLFPASVILVYTFTGYVPPYRCFVDGFDNETTPQYHVEASDWYNLTIPLNNTIDDLNKCRRFNITQENIYGSVPIDFSSSNLIKCDRWVFDRSVFTSTVATDYALTCENTWKNTFVGSLTMIGLMIGSFFLGPLADLLGRRLAFLILSLFLASMAIGSSFAPNYETFATLRFLTGMGGMALIQTNFIWGVEFMLPELRIKYIFVLNLTQAIGNLITGMVAYFIRDWRNVHLIIFCPMALLISYFFFLPESPRWLISRKKYAEAKTIFERAAKMNGKQIPPHLLEIPSESKLENAEKTISESEPNNDSILDVFKTLCLLKRLFILCLAWASSMLCYYGLAYSSTNLAGDLFLNYILVILVEIPACLTGMFVVEWLGRRPIVNSTLMLGGIFCLAAGLIPKDQTAAVIACSMIGKYFISMQSVTINMMTSELFPTSVRGITIGICSTIGKLGGILAPIIATMGKENAALPYIIFGVINIVIGLLSLLLPETKGSRMPATIEDAIALEKNLISLPKIKPRIKRNSYNLGHDN